MQTADGEVIITNDGATILNKIKVEQPAAKMLVDLSKSQVGGLVRPASIRANAPVLCLPSHACKSSKSRFLRMPH